MGYKSWDELRRDSDPHVTDVIVEGLRNRDDVDPLSRETVEFLCAFNNIQQMHGNYIAHNASQIEIKNAIMLKRNSQDGLHLEELYQFAFPTPI